jgi:phosphatidate phosphatase APP1
MADWVKWVSDLMGAVNAQWDALKVSVKQQLGIRDPIYVMPYYGYGTPQKLRIKGRVLQDEGLSLREENAPIWKNLVTMYRRFETDEVPGAPIRIQIGDQQQEVVTDAEGYFDAEIDLHSQLAVDRLWQPIQIELLLDEPTVVDDSVVAEAIVVSEQAKFGVISDIDDTIMHTAATDFLKMIRIAYLGNEQTRRPFEGVPEFYQALQQGESDNAGNPIFYVSSSAWNMYDLFAKFMKFNAIPKGPILLREIELAPDNLLSFDHEAHKREQIRPILEQFSDLSFILIGDTGQKDADIYRQIAEDYPGRILAIYLRNVTPQNRDRLQQLAALQAPLQQQSVDYLVFSHTSELAQHVASKGWTTQRNPQD